MSEELSAPLQEWWNLYLAAVREAEYQAILQLLSTKNTIEEMTLETGQKLLFAYDQDSDNQERKQ
jgi:hypothetical protein